MIRAAIYARVSTDQQAQEGDSIPAQLDALTKYVNDHPDMTLAGEYIDEGISGRKADRDELQRLLDDVRDGKIDHILFTKLDRWFRSVRHYTATQELLDKHGVGWTAIWEPIYDTTTPAGRLIINQMQSIAQFEAENTSQRIKAVMAYKVAQGEAVTGKTPMGYRIQDKHLVIVPEEAELVRQIFETYDVTGSLGATARFAQSVGYVVEKQNLKHTLRNRKYIGEHRGNLNYCPPIVDRDVFERVQHNLKINVSIASKRIHIFTGILKCGVCGHRMASAFDGTKSECGYSFYRCPCYYNPPRRCTNKRTCGEKYLESYLVDQLPVMAIKIQAEAKAEQAKQADTTKQIAALDRKIARLKDLYLAEEISLDEYKKDKSDFESQKAALAVPEPPKNDFSAVNDLLAIKNLKELIEGLEPQEKQVFWRRLIREIRFLPDRSFQVDFF